MADTKKDTRLKRVGVSGYNTPKRTPNHPTKSHVVVAKVGTRLKQLDLANRESRPLVRLK
tara:strand:+ start:222 stop:401 length:180 start_codon:yes stop_codon:yes gene_type:complete